MRAFKRVCVCVQVYLPLEQKRFGEFVQLNVERVQLLDVMLLVGPQVHHRVAGHRRIVLLERNGETQVERFLEHVLRDLGKQKTCLIKHWYAHHYVSSSFKIWLSN